MMHLSTAIKAFSRGQHQHVAAGTAKYGSLVEAKKVASGVEVGVEVSEAMDVLSLEFGAELMHQRCCCKAKMNEEDARITVSQSSSGIFSERWREVPSSSILKMRRDAKMRAKMRLKLRVADTLKHRVFQDLLDQERKDDHLGDEEVFQETLERIIDRERKPVLLRDSSSSPMMRKAYLGLPNNKELYFVTVDLTASGILRALQGKNVRCQIPLEEIVDIGLCQASLDVCYLFLSNNQCITLSAFDHGNLADLVAILEFIRRQAMRETFKPNLRHLFSGFSLFGGVLASAKCVDDVKECEFMYLEVDDVMDPTMEGWNTARFLIKLNTLYMFPVDGNPEGLPSKFWILNDPSRPVEVSQAPSKSLRPNCIELREAMSDRNFLLATSSSKEEVEWRSALEKASQHNYTCEDAGGGVLLTLPCLHLSEKELRLFTFHGRVTNLRSKRLSRCLDVSASVDKLLLKLTFRDDAVWSMTFRAAPTMRNFLCTLKKLTGIQCLSLQ